MCVEYLIPVLTEFLNLKTNDSLELPEHTLTPNLSCGRNAWEMHEKCGGKCGEAPDGSLPCRPGLMTAAPWSPFWWPVLRIWAGYCWIPWLQCWFCFLWARRSLFGWKLWSRDQERLRWRRFLRRCRRYVRLLCRRLSRLPCYRWQGRRSCSWSARKKRRRWSGRYSPRFRWRRSPALRWPGLR